MDTYLTIFLVITTLAGWYFIGVVVVRLVENYFLRKHYSKIEAEDFGFFAGLWWPLTSLRFALVYTTKQLRNLVDKLP